MPVTKGVKATSRALARLASCGSSFSMADATMSSPRPNGMRARPKAPMAAAPKNTNVEMAGSPKILAIPAIAVNAPTPIKTLSKRTPPNFLRANAKGIKDPPSRPRFKMPLKTLTFPKDAIAVANPSPRIVPSPLAIAFGIFGTFGPLNLIVEASFSFAGALASVSLSFFRDDPRLPNPEIKPPKGFLIAPPSSAVSLLRASLNFSFSSGVNAM